MPYDLPDLALRLLGTASEVCDLHDHLVSRYGTFRALKGHKYIPGKFQVVRYDKTEILISLECPHNLVHSMGKDLHDSAFLPLAALCRSDRHLHRILVKCAVRCGFRNEDVLIHSFNGHKTESLGMAFINT